MSPREVMNTYEVGIKVYNCTINCRFELDDDQFRKIKEAHEEGLGKTLHQITGDNIFLRIDEEESRRVVSDLICERDKILKKEQDIFEYRGR